MLRCLSLAVDVTLHTITANFLVIIGAAIGAKNIRRAEFHPHALDLLRDLVEPRSLVGIL